MNSIKNIFRLAMVAFAAIAMSACQPVSEPNGGGNGGDENSDFALVVDVENITATSAKIKVLHNGKTANSWYGLLTTDTATREDELISQTVAELTAGDLGSLLIFSKNYTKILSPLSPETTYSYIAFGLTEEGVVYGSHSSVEFTTLAAGSEGGDGNSEDEVYEGMLPNPAWSIAYTGAGTVNQQQYDHTVTVNSTDNNPYTIAVVYASEYDPSKLRDLGQGIVDSMIEYLNSYNSAYGTKYVLNDMLYRGSAVEAFDNLDPGYYIALAIGITAKGEVSGLYAVSQTFHIEEQKPTTLYSSWLGDWEFKGDNNVTNQVIIGRKVANKSVNLFGLQALPFAVEGLYSTERNDIIFAAQVVEQNCEFSDGSVGDVHLIGLSNDGSIYGLENGNYGIAIAGVLENGKRAVVRYGVNEPGYPKFVAMILTAYIADNYYSIGEDVVAFNGIAELAPLAQSAGAKRSQILFGKGKLLGQPKTLKLGRRLESKRISATR